MRLLITVLLIVFSQISFAKDTLVDDCSHLKEASEAQFALFSKKEFMQLGECLAVDTIKRKPIANLAMLCNEVIEYKDGPLGVMSLTKLEAIYIGQCAGIINYIYQRYNDEYVSKNNSWYGKSKKYTCHKGINAVNILSAKAKDKSSRVEIRDLLCTGR